MLPYHERNTAQSKRKILIYSAICSLSISDNLISHQLEDNALGTWKQQEKK